LLAGATPDRATMPGQYQPQFDREFAPMTHNADYCNYYADASGRQVVEAHVHDHVSLLEAMRNESVNCILITQDIIFPQDYFEPEARAWDDAHARARGNLRVNYGSIALPCRVHLNHSRSRPDWKAVRGLRDRATIGPGWGTARVNGAPCHCARTNSSLPSSSLRRAIYLAG
jgi:hypothetical protein